MGDIVQSTDAPSSGILELRVYPGRNGSFTFIEDDGMSYNYTNGKVRKTIFTWNDSKKTLSWNVADSSYDGDNVFKKIKVVVGEQEQLVGLNNSGQLVF